MQSLLKCSGSEQEHADAVARADFETPGTLKGIELRSLVMRSGIYGPV